MRRYPAFRSTPALVSALSSVGTAPVSGDHTGNVAQTLAPLTSAAAGTVAMSGAASDTLGAVTSGATGTVAMTGVLAVTLGALTVRASNVLSAPAGRAAWQGPQVSM